MLLYIVYALKEGDFTKVAYITDKVEEKIWFLTTAAHVTHKCFVRSFLFQALVYKM
jgi:hypothetical protein